MSFYTYEMICNLLYTWRYRYMYKKISEELIDFIKNSPTDFHAIDNISKRLKENGYEELL